MGVIKCEICDVSVWRERERASSIRSDPVVSFNLETHSLCQVCHYLISHNFTLRYHCELSINVSVQLISREGMDLLLNCFLAF